MLKSGQKRPNISSKSKSALVVSGGECQDAGVGHGHGHDHLRQPLPLRLRETVLTACNDGALNLNIHGGSDIGQFTYINDIVQNKINYVSGKLIEDDVILEIQGQKVAGYTQRDVVAWLNHCCRNGNPVTLKTIDVGCITRDLRQFLNTRFQKGSVDHVLQNTIRDNLYLRTVPVTTRGPREGEVNGVDYTFLTPEEFTALEKSGNLLESGIYEGNHYGTPKPSKEPPVCPPQSSELTSDSSDIGIIPGAHPSSEGKRRRNRSNVEAMAAKTMEAETINDERNNVDHPENVDLPPSYFNPNENSSDSLRLDLGPLPPNWEKAYTERGEVYFIDHNSGTSHWLDPRLSKFQKKSLEECLDDELPYGWEKIDDPQYGTYYIDHVNRRTQYENPVIQAKRAAQENGPKISHSISKRSNNLDREMFTRNPNELRGERIQTTLVKSSRGLGFTIVGGDDSEEEFLQIKSVVPNGPAWLDGKLQTGDVLVYVNETCVLGYTHHDMVSMFQSISPSETVTLEVCRGYPLPFDPNDPNTEVVTTVAVNAPDTMTVDASVYMDREGNIKETGYNFLDISSETAAHVHNGSEDLVNSSVKSMPDLCSSEKIKNIQRPNSTDILLNESVDFIDSKIEFLTIPIVKGAMGFGFTIADSAYGQKVKKILDRQRCKNLLEGDILIEINSTSVHNMSHGEVVQVLKDCARNQEARVTVQRGGHASPGKNKVRKKDENLLFGRKNVYRDSMPGLYRSKTPTAELYSTQQKEIIPNRPKTPLVDTRNRPKTPTSNSEHISWTSQNPESLINNESRFNHETNSEQNEVESNDPIQNSASSLGNYDPYKNSYNYPHPYESNARKMTQSPLSNLNDRLASTSIQDNSMSISAEYSRNYNMNNNDLEIESHENWNKYSDTTPRSYHNNTSEEIPSQAYNRPYVTSPYSSYDPSYVYAYSDAQTNSEYMVHKDFMYPQNIMTYNDIQNFTSPSVLPTNSEFYIQDMNSKRKESTSFEHEQPHPSNIIRNPRDVRHMQIPQSVARRYTGEDGQEWFETVITLVRQESGFGFRIVGGTEEGSQVSIGHVVPGGAADLDSRLCTGDEILSVDNESVLNTSHHHVVQLMGKAASNGHVTLGIRRRITTQEIGYPYDVTVTRRENEGFGFVIISSVNKAGSTIGRIIDGSPAERCSQLHVGDRILAVNHIDIMNLPHLDIVNLIKDSGYSVTLTIGPPIDDTSSTASVPQREEDGILSEEEQYHAVELSRGTRGFGFSIRGGREFHNMPLFVLQIADNGPAALDSRLKIGDQIIEINGINTKNMTHAEAIEIIRNGGPSVRLLVRRGGKIPPLPPAGGI